MNQPVGRSVTENPLPNPADAFFKEGFSHLPSARNFFQQYLPPILTSQSDWASLAREPETFLDATLRSKFADLLFSCNISGRQAFFYLLLEHKSTPEFWTSFHLLELMLRIWRKQLDNTSYAQEKLPMIIPFVLHQGPKGWHHSVKFADYIAWPDKGREELEHCMVNFQHLLLDLAKMPWEEIRGEARLRLTMILMKAVREGRLLELLPKVAPLFAELEKGESLAHFLQALARYLMEVDKTKASTIEVIAHKLSTEETKSQIMTLAEHIREQGLNEGLKKGLDSGMVIGQLITCREILGLPELRTEEWEHLPLEELRKILAQLKAKVALHLKE